MIRILIIVTVLLFSSGCGSIKSSSVTDSMPAHHILPDDAYMQAHAHDTIDMSDSAWRARLVKSGLCTQLK